MTKEQKAEVIKDTVERVGKATGLYLASFQGLTVDQANTLRSEFFKIGVDYKVVKNTLLKHALRLADTRRPYRKYYRQLIRSCPGHRWIYQCSHVQHRLRTGCYRKTKSGSRVTHTK